MVAAFDEAAALDRGGRAMTTSGVCNMATTAVLLMTSPAASGGMRNPGCKKGIWKPNSRILEPNSATVVGWSVAKSCMPEIIMPDARMESPNK